MLYAPTFYSSGGCMTEAHRKLRLSAAARHVGLDPAYLSRIAKRDDSGTSQLEREGVTVMRNPDYPDVVEMYQDEIEEWAKTHHAARSRKKRS